MKLVIGSATRLFTKQVEVLPTKTLWERKYVHFYHLFHANNYLKLLASVLGRKLLHNIDHKSYWPWGQNTYRENGHEHDYGLS